MKTEQVAHTALPWVIDADSETTVSANKASWTDRPVTLALVYDPNDHTHRTPISVANAAYIVKACNAYPKLVGNLRTFHAFVKHGILPTDEEMAVCESLLNELGEL